MLIQGLICTITTLPLLVLSSPTSSDFQTVQFVPTKKPLRRSARNTSTRSSRHAVFRPLGSDISDYFSFTLTQPDEGEVWTENPPSTNDLRFDIYHNGHVTPDFSDGLRYPDPFLLVGPAARRTTSYLYSRELFFGNIPHRRLVVHNQELRRRNGLSGNRLGSLNQRSPWLRRDNTHLALRQGRGRPSFRFQY